MRRARPGGGKLRGMRGRVLVRFAVVLLVAQGDDQAWMSLVLLLAPAVVVGLLAPLPVAADPERGSR